MTEHHDTSPETGRQRIVLDTAPSLGGLYAKAAGSTLVRGASTGIRRALKGAPLPRPGKRSPGGPDLGLPPVELVASGLAVDAEGHEAFCRVVGARLRSSPSGRTKAFSGYLHAMAFPVAMALLTRDDFPLPTVGLVHLANTVEHAAPVFVGETLEAVVRAEELRPHRAGAAFDVVVELRRPPADGDAAPGAPGTPWNRPVWTGRSVYLARGVNVGTAADSERPAFVPPVPTARWQLGSATGREYAAVSGDVNPIHLSAASARALGMKGAIAHGMYTASRALAMLDAPAPLRWEVEFGAPLLLPASPAVAVERDGRGSDLHDGTVTVWDAKRKRPYAVLRLHR